jgi:hypothetical protein
METHQDDATALTRMFAKYKYGALEILFRELHEMPRTWAPDWLVEAYEWGAEEPPIGFCWCSVGPHATAPIVIYVKVFDADRRAGVASALIAAAQRRWPNLNLGEGASPDGTAFLEAYRNRVEKGEEGSILITDEEEAGSIAFDSWRAGGAG